MKRPQYALLRRCRGEQLATGVPIRCALLCFGVRCLAARYALTTDLWFAANMTDSLRRRGRSHRFRAPPPRVSLRRLAGRIRPARRVDARLDATVTRVWWPFAPARAVTTITFHRWTHWLGIAGHTGGPTTGRTIGPTKEIGAEVHVGYSDYSPHLPLSGGTSILASHVREEARMKGSEYAGGCMQTRGKGLV